MKAKEALGALAHCDCAGSQTHTQTTCWHPHRRALQDNGPCHHGVFPGAVLPPACPRPAHTPTRVPPGVGCPLAQPRGSCSSLSLSSLPLYVGCSILWQEGGCDREETPRSPQESAQLPVGAGLPAGLWPLSRVPEPLTRTVRQEGDPLAGSVLGGVLDEQLPAQGGHRCEAQ